MMIKPSVVIKRHNGEPYLRRWHLIPRNRFCNVYLHHFVGSDDERALHCHPWASVSLMLKGEIGELYIRRPNGPRGWDRIPTMRSFRPGQWVYRPAEFAHRLIVPKGKSVWTLFLTGPRIREWGFHCVSGFKHWRDYDRDGGCDA